MRNRIVTVSALLVAFALAPVAIAANEPIVELKNIKPKRELFQRRPMPIKISTAKEAAKYFPADSVKAIEKQVDFGKRFLVVFAWSGSGQDRITYDVAEIFFEQVGFRYRPGFTRDLRPHLNIYSLRNNVRWSFNK